LASLKDLPSLENIDQLKEGELTLFSIPGDKVEDSG